MVIVLENEIRKQGSNPGLGCLHFTFCFTSRQRLSEKHESICSSTSYEKIVGQTELFSLG